MPYLPAGKVVWGLHSLASALEREVAALVWRPAGRECTRLIFRSAQLFFEGRVISCGDLTP
jgi:hypothetical protein